MKETAKKSSLIWPNGAWLEMIQNKTYVVQLLKLNELRNKSGGDVYTSVKARSVLEIAFFYVRKEIT